MNRIEASPASGDPLYRLSMQNLRDGKVIWERESPLSTLRFSPDGKLLAAASQFGPRIQVYSVDDGAEVASLAGHAAGVNCLAFSPEGTRLASCSADTTVLVWDLAAAIQASGNWIDRRRTLDAF